MRKLKIDNPSDWEVIEIKAGDPKLNKALSHKSDDEDDWELIEIPEKKSSSVQKAFLTGANGAAFGMFPEVAGRVKGQGRGIAEFAKSLLLDHKLVNPRSDAARALNRTEYLKTKNNIQGDIDQYAKEHPYMSMLADMAGSIPTSVAMPGAGLAKVAKYGGKVANLAAKAPRFVKAAGAGASYGGLRGAGDSTNRSDDLNDTISSMLKGAGIGGALGGTVGAVLSPFMVTKYQKLAKAVGEDRIKEAIMKKIPLLKNANIRTMQYAKGIQSRGKPEALEKFENYKQAMEKGQKNEIYKIIDENISKDNYANLVRQIEEEAEKIYAPLYKEAEKAGEIPRPRTQDSEVIKDSFKLARKTSDDLRGLPDNNIKVLQRVKEKLDERISKHKALGEESSARDFSILKDKLIDDIDDSVLAHSPARSAYAKMKNQLKAVKRGYKNTPKFLLEDLDTLKPIEGLTEEEALPLMRAGLAQHFRNKNLNTSQIDTDLYRKVFSHSDLEKGVKAKILKPEEMNKILDTIYAAEKDYSNIRSLTKISQPEKEVSAVGVNNPAHTLVAPKKTAIKATDRWWERFGRVSDIKGADYLTDANALKQFVERHIAQKNKLELRDVGEKVLYKILGGQKGKKKREEE
jgi:hypothetical protein